jgi:hypothetical protein
MSFVPMAVKIEDARRMAAAAKKADVHTMGHGPFSFGVAALLPSQVWWSLVNLFGKGSALGYFLTRRAATAMVSVAAVA